MRASPCNRAQVDGPNFRESTPGADVEVDEAVMNLEAVVNVGAVMRKLGRSAAGAQRQAEPSSPPGRLAKEPGAHGAIIAVGSRRSRFGSDRPLSFTKRIS